MGGSTPFLAARVAVLSNHMGCLLSPDEIIDDFKTFYYDTALSAYETNLLAIDSFIRPDQLLFGTDFPGMFESIILQRVIMTSGHPRVKLSALTWLNGIQQISSNIMRLILKGSRE